MEKTELKVIKCVIVGDGSVGKTCMLVSYISDKFPTDYVPTIFEHYTANIEVDNQVYKLSLSDTAGQEDYEHLRTLVYPQANVFIIAFSVIDPSSFENATKKWYPELNEHNKKATKIFAGNKIDMRDEKLTEVGKGHVSKEIGEKVVSRMGCKYLECSALTQEGLHAIFNEAIRSCSGKNDKRKDDKGVDRKVDQNNENCNCSLI